MENVEAAETNLGKLVPMHLLKFNGDHQLQTSFRQLIETAYEKGIVKSECGFCEACGHPLTSKSKTRLKPSKKKTSKVIKLLAKDRVGSLFGKYNNYVLKKFKKSCTQMIIWCIRCKHLNRQDLISNETKQALKDKIYQEVLLANEKEISMSSQKKKKKKQRRKKKLDEQGDCDFNISSKPKQEHATVQSASRNSQSKFVPGTLDANFKSGTLKAFQSSPKRKTELMIMNTPLKKKKSGLKQKELKQLLEQGPSESDKKRTSLADFLSSL
ncbi:hypothetical protein PoB_002045300 [Plakobranchus ocellatus]|uniref:Uncharacterized protein n=1 Tax=Plakobranchus ocellatus TaxID=259542 RepID=A0AAV3ZGM6_9GAST|nr:hypothetical protein PoB_002045300 [Plakobranchus ocellatus]